jgi:hypothetical protein
MRRWRHDVLETAESEVTERMLMNVKRFMSLHNPIIMIYEEHYQ